MEKISYFIKEGFRNFWVNRLMMLASVSLLVVCLILLGTSLMLSINIQKIIVNIQDQNQIMVFMKLKADQTTVVEAGDAIEKLPNVKHVTFISKQQGLELYKKELGPDLVEGLDKDNPLPDSYQVQLKSMDQYAKTVTQLKGISGVDTVREHIDIADKLSGINRVISMTGFWLFIALGAISLFLIANTIKAAVFVRKREINIMKFVGATDWFIRWPFVVEGLLIGLLSAIVAFGLQWLIYSYPVTEVIKAFGMIKPVPFTNLTIYLIPGFAVAGVLVGVFGSIISVRRYLKV